jgi:putative acetyltransferase
MEIIAAHEPQYLADIRTLFEEYWSAFGFTPCFQNFSAELAELPGDYAPPTGRLGVALVEGEPAGCAALRHFGRGCCEAKRLYVRPQFRGRGIGRALLDWVVTEARTAGYREIVGDTMPAMSHALAMYNSYGFERTGPYSADPTPDAIFLRLRLR